MPNLPYTGPIIAASQRTGIQPEVMPGTDVIGQTLKQYMPDSMNTPTIDPVFNRTMQRKEAMTVEDFGIPENVKEAMKVRSAQQINSAYDTQREAAKRMMAKAGLLNDPAAIKADVELDQARLGEVFKNYTDIDTQDALKANEQYQKNLNDLLQGSMEGFKTQEDARQFERAYDLDRYRS